MHSPESGASPFYMEHRGCRFCEPDTPVGGHHVLSGQVAPAVDDVPGVEPGLYASDMINTMLDF